MSVTRTSRCWSPGPAGTATPRTPSGTRSSCTTRPPSLDDAEIPGRYPPEDTGTAGLYGCKALKARGLISSYWHGFSLAAVLAELAVRPVSIGVPWMESMFYPAPRSGLLRVDRRSGVAGGHQVCLDGVTPGNRRVRLANSWGNWGVKGWAWLGWDDLGWLLSQGGDAVSVRR